MFVRSTAEAPVWEPGGLVSRVLLQEGDTPGAELAATGVGVAPRAGQQPHEHDAKQVYVALEGRGRMRVGDEEREVGHGGGPVYVVPSGAVRGIEDASGGPPAYVSAAGPVTDALAAYDAGQLRPGREEA